MGIKQEISDIVFYISSFLIIIGTFLGVLF